MFVLFVFCFFFFGGGVQVRGVRVDVNGEVKFLPHLSRRLIGELIVYTGIRRPASGVHCPSTFHTTSSLKPLGRFFPYSIYSIYR